MSHAPHLLGLNDAQLRAVVSTPDGSLQILAGPGSGKTATLCARVAHLITEHRIPAGRILVNTFTNKAANEMKHRLRKTVGEQVAGELIMGTFHAVCVRFLRRHGYLIDLRSGWNIADEGDNQTLVKKLLAEHRDAFIEAHCEPPKPGQIRDIICKAKAKGLTPAEHAEAAEGAFQMLCSQIFSAYQDALERDNALDFDDLLIQGYRLFVEHPRVIADIRHVFIDEFQDTNTIQYLITKCLAQSSQALTVVGDPDQSIYGWRSAQVENLDLMCKDFRHTQQIFLEQNYRSTGAILSASLAVVSQDRERIQKSLFTSHPTGLPVILRACSSAPMEADFIANEIKRLIAHTGGMLDFNDFAILLRFNALSRLIESSLQKAGLPCRIVGGHRFFERIEVRDILAYLNLVDNPLSTAAFRRIINVPKRSIGTKTVDTIIEAAATRKVSPFDIVLKAARGQNICGLKPAQRTALRPFVECIAKARVMASEGTDVPTLIDHIVDAIDYKGYLERAYATDATTRLENVRELSSFAQQVAQEHHYGLDLAGSESAPIGEDQVAARLESGERSDAADLTDVALDDESQSETSENFDELMDKFSQSQSHQTSQTSMATPIANPLRLFLEASMLSTDAETEDAKDDKAKPKITISTCHAAKGLEWPVIFVPAIEDGTFPFYRATDDDAIREERRLLYVAMTRAKTILCLSHSRARMRGADMQNQRISPFIAPLSTPDAKVFAFQPASIDAQARSLIGKVIGRDCVSESLVAKEVAAWQKTQPREPSPLADAPTGNVQRSSWSGYSKAGSSSSRTGNASSWNQRSHSSLPPVNATSGFSKAGSGAPAVSGYSNKPFRPPSQAPPRPSPGLSADVFMTETRQSRIGNGSIYGQSEPAAAAPAGLDRWQQASHDSIASLKALLPADGTSDHDAPPRKRHKPFGTSRLE